MGTTHKPLRPGTLATAMQTLVCRHRFNREVNGAPNERSRNSAAIRAEHAELKKLQAMGTIGLDRAMVASRRESLTAVAAQLGIILR